jgi:hypothetical protein
LKNGLDFMRAFLLETGLQELPEEVMITKPATI